MSSEHTIQPAPLPPDWQQRATAISNAATDTYVLACDEAVDKILNVPGQAASSR